MELKDTEPIAQIIFRYIILSFILPFFLLEFFPEMSAGNLFLAEMREWSRLLTPWAHDAGWLGSSEGVDMIRRSWRRKALAGKLQNSTSSKSNEYLTWGCIFIFGSGFTSHILPGLTLELVGLPEAHTDYHQRKWQPSGMLATRGKPSGLDICHRPHVPVTSPWARETRNCQALWVMFSCRAACFNNSTSFMQARNENIFFFFFSVGFRLSV